MTEKTGEKGTKDGTGPFVRTTSKLDPDSVRYRLGGLEATMTPQPLSPMALGTNFVTTVEGHWRFCS